MKYCVIGLGVFGRHLCLHLSQLGAEVLAIDCKEENVAAIKDIVDAAIEIDYTDPRPFSRYPIDEMDAVFIAIGDNFEASMALTLRMQELNAKKIVARVLSPMHERLLKLLKVHRIVVPEEYAARGLAHSVMMRGVVDGYDLGDKHVVIEAKTPAGLVGKTLATARDKFQKYQILLITVKRMTSDDLDSRDTTLEEIQRKTLGVPKQETDFKLGDILVLFGHEKSLAKFLDDPAIAKAEKQADK